MTDRPAQVCERRAELMTGCSRARAWLGAGVALISACGGGGSATGRGGADFGPSLAPDSLCSTFTRALCSYLMQCQGVPYCDLDHCLSRNSCYGFSELAHALDTGAVAYDSSKGGACFESFGNDPCHFGSLPVTPDVFDVLAQCPGALAPELKQGDRCVSSSECGASSYCKNTGHNCPGVCTSFATAGEACGAGASCGVGLMCNSRNLCQPSGADGSPCAGYADCGPPSSSLWCSAMAGTCMPGVASGAACGATVAGLTVCAQGLWCDAVSIDGQGVCRPSGDAGAPCNDQGACQTALHCAGYQPSGANATLGQCTPPATAGGNCELSSDCATGLVCNYGACGPPFDVGLRCRSDSYCQQGLTCATEKCLHASCPGEACSDPSSACVLSVCKDGRCQDRAKAGEACVVGGDCLSGACVAGRCADASACPP
jgi:hypothetical protein